METNIKFVHIDNEHSRYWLMQKAWAEEILAQPDVVFLNGRHSHDCAHEVHAEAMDELIDDLAVQVTA